MSYTPSAVIFDLDGTLVDSARDLSAALNHVLRGEKRPEIDLSHVRHMVGDGAKAFIIKGFTETGPLPNEMELKDILKEFLDYYSKNIAQKTIIFPGALNILRKLSDQGIPLALCTNKVMSLTTKLISEIGLADYFDVVVGGDSFAWQKPDPRHISSTLEILGCSANKAIMVGDSSNDILAAREAGLKSICVSFGYSKIPVAQLNPDAIIDHYDDFFAELNKIPR